MTAAAAAAVGDDPYGTAELRGRIREALAQLGMKQTDLAPEAGLSTYSMSRLMTGKRDISAGELGMLAHALGKSVSWLAEGTPSGAGTGQPAQVSQTGAGVGAVQAASRTYAFAARLVERAADNPGLNAATKRAFDLIETEAELDLLVTTEAPALPQLPELPQTTYKKLAGQEMAERIRTAFGLGAEPIEDFTAFAWTHFGLRVAREPLATSLDGLLATDTSAETGTTGNSDGAGMVPSLAVVNTTRRRLGRQRFTAAHELGHLLFGDASDDLHADLARAADGDHIELRANTFAAELLAPAAGVLALAEDPYKVTGDRAASAGETARVLWIRQVVADVAAHFGISVESAIIRCEAVNLIAKAERVFLEKMARNGVTELLRVTGHEAYAEADEAAVGLIDPPESLSGKALFAYGEGLIGLGTLGRVWNTGDLTALRAELAEAGWAPTSTT